MINTKMPLPLLILILLLACNSQNMESIGEVTQIPSVPTISNETTRELSKDHTETAFEKTAYTRTITQSVTITSTPDITFTSLPTLSPNEALELIQNLSKSINSCRLPCWWGMIPGQSNWLIEKHHLETFASKITNEVSTKSDSDGKVHDIGNHYIDFELNNNEKGTLFIGTEDNTIIEIIPSAQLLMSNYELSEILTNYGAPTSIFIRTFVSTPEPPSPFTVFIFFAEENMLLMYETTAEISKDEIVGCFSSTIPRLWIWSPDKDMSNYVKEVIFGSNYPTHVLSIEQAIDGMDSENFYKTFKSEACIKTSVKKWK